MRRRVRKVGGDYVEVGRIDQHGNVFDRQGYDTGKKVPIMGVPIRDERGRISPGASVGSDGIVRDGQGRCIPRYTKVVD